jgi:uncharacterized membrane protein (DUF373 family)
MHTNQRPLVVKVVIALHILLGLSGLAGGAAMILAPDGRILSIPVSMLADSPFSSYLIPGLLLFIFLGVYPLLSAYAQVTLPSWRQVQRNIPIKNLHWAWLAAFATGPIAIIWIATQIALIGYTHPLQPTILALGALLIILAITPAMRQHYSLHAHRSKRTKSRPRRRRSMHA